MAHTGVIPIGGDHFTSDLSVGLCTPVAEAEKIKRLYGNAIVTLIPEGNEVEVPSVGDRPSRLISQRMVGEILEPRARELFEMLRDNLRHAGMFELCVGGHRADRRRMPLARHSRNCGVGAAPAAAPGLAGAAGQNAVHAGRARVRNRSGHGVLRTPRPHRPRHSERALEFEVEGHVGRQGSIGICSAGILPAVRGLPALRSRFATDCEIERQSKQAKFTEGGVHEKRKRHSHQLQRRHPQRRQDQGHRRGRRRQQRRQPHDRCRHGGHRIRRRQHRPAGAAHVARAR